MASQNEAEAGAAFCACWTSTRRDAMRAAQACGMPICADPDLQGGREAQLALLSAGVKVGEGTLEMTPEALNVYEASPWAKDLAAKDVLRFATDVDDAELMATEREAESALAAFNEEDRMRRRLAGRIKRGLDAIKAAQIIARLSPQDAANMLERGGKGSGAWWAAKPSANLVWMGNRHFLIALKRRLRQPVLAEGCVCAHKHQTGKKVGQAGGRKNNGATDERHVKRTLENCNNR